MSLGAEPLEVAFIRQGDFGLRIDELGGQDSGKLKVRAVLPGGCVAKFNQALPESAIRVGDVITSINGEAASAASLKGLAEGQEVKLTIRRLLEQAQAPQPEVMGAAEHGERRGAAPPSSIPVVEGKVVGAAGARRLPPGVPPGSHFAHEMYVGGTTTAFAVGGCLCCGPLACCILACPIDERDVYIAPDGRKFTAAGALIV